MWRWMGGERWRDGYNDEWPVVHPNKRCAWGGAVGWMRWHSILEREGRSGAKRPRARLLRREGHSVCA